MAGDIGGTKTDLMIFSPESGPRSPLEEASFSSARYTSLDALIRDFLSQINLRVERATLGLAGPVVESHAKITNLPWTIDEIQLTQALSLSSVRLMNDVEAIACAVPHLDS